MYSKCNSITVDVLKLLDKRTKVRNRFEGPLNQSSVTKRRCF